MSSRFRKALSHSVSSLVGAAATLAVLYANHENDERRRESNSAEESSRSTSFRRKSSELSSNDNEQQEGRRRINNIATDNVLASNFPYIQSPVSTFQPNPNLQIVYDARTKNPIYVMERLGSVSSSSNQPLEQQLQSNNKFNFREPKALSPQHRSRNAYYRNSGFDRGHLAPAADYKYNAKYKMDTYTLANISPQYPVFNRKIWVKVEEWVRRQLVRSDSFVGSDDSDHDQNCNEVYVITGPLWLPSKKLSNKYGKSRNDTKRNVYQYSHYGIGTPPTLVHVPTHFFKVIFTMKKNNNNYKKDDELHSSSIGKTQEHQNNVLVPSLSLESVDQFAAFVIPNHESIHDYKFIEEEDIKLSDFVVQLADIEAVTGISFFPSSKTTATATTNILTNKVDDDDDDDHEEIDSQSSTTLEIFDLITELYWCTTTPPPPPPPLTNKSDGHIDNIEGTNNNGTTSLPDKYVMYREASSSSAVRNKKKKCRQIRKRIRDILQNDCATTSTWKSGSIFLNNNREQDTIVQILPKHICSDDGCSQVLIKRQSRKSSTTRSENSKYYYIN